MSPIAGAKASVVVGGSLSHEAAPRKLSLRFPPRPRCVAQAEARGVRAEEMSANQEA